MTTTDILLSFEMRGSLDNKQMSCEFLNFSYTGSFDNIQRYIRHISMSASYNSIYHKHYKYEPFKQTTTIQQPPNLSNAIMLREMKKTFQQCLKPSQTTNSKIWQYPNTSQTANLKTLGTIPINLVSTDFSKINKLIN